MCPNNLFVPVVNSQYAPAAVTENSGCSSPAEGNLGRPKESCKRSSKGGNELHEECYKKYLKTFIEALSLALG